LKKWLIISLLIIPLGALAQMENYIEEDPEPIVQRHRGFAFSLLEYGSGLGGFWEYPMRGYYHLGFSFDAIMLRDSKEFTIPTYYGYTYQFNKKNNVYMFDILFSLKKRLFTHALDNSIRPFVGVQAGPVYAMNFPEKYLDENNEIVKRKNQYMWTMSGMGEVGIDADVNPQNFMAIRFQYRIIPFASKLGERKNQSTFDIRLEVGQRF